MKKIKRPKSGKNRTQNSRHWLEAKRIETAPKLARIEALYAVSAQLPADEVDKHYKLTSSINTLSKSLREDHEHNLKIDRELIALRQKDRENPSEKELNKRRERLIAELCGMANSLTADDYEPDILARLIEEEEKEARHGG